MISIWLAKGLKQSAKPKNRRQQCAAGNPNKRKKKEAMVARARARDAKRHEDENRPPSTGPQIGSVASESNATNEALRSMVREITQKHVAALAALGVAEEKAETALLSAQKLKPARAFSEESGTEPEPEPEPTTPQLRFAKARSDARDDLHAARASRPEAARRGDADREALAAGAQVSGPSWAS